MPVVVVVGAAAAGGLVAVVVIGRYVRVTNERRMVFSAD